MLMQTMTRESWTDERLDDLNDKVDRGFDPRRVTASMRVRRRRDSESNLGENVRK